MTRLLLLTLFLIAIVRNYSTPTPNVIEIKGHIICGDESSMLAWHEIRQDGFSYIHLSPLNSDINIRLAGSLTENAFDPAGIPFADSNFIFVWMSYNKNRGASINGAIVKTNGDILRSWTICDYDGVDRYRPVIIGLNANEYMAVWQDAKAGNYDIIGYWGGIYTNTKGKFIRINDDTTQFSQYYPVVCKTNERILVSWEDRRLGHSAIWAQFMNFSGEKEGNNFLIAPEVIFDQTGVSVAGYNNRISIVWQVAKPETMAIMLRFLDTTEKEYNLVQVSDSNIAQARADARCAFFHDGKLVVVWMDQRHAMTHVYAQLFDVDGKRIGNNFVIEKLTEPINTDAHTSDTKGRTTALFDRDQFLPDVNIDREGRLFVCWTEVGDDGVTLKLKSDTLNWKTWISEEYYQQIAKRYWLHCPLPSLFSQKVSIKYELPVSAKVVIRIYDVIGRQITELINNDLAAGVHNLIWDGKDRLGREVSTGSYYILMQADDFLMKRKVIKMK